MLDSFVYRKRLHEGFGRGDFRKAALTVMQELPNDVGHYMGRTDLNYGMMLMPAFLGAECTLRSSATAFRDLFELMGIQAPCAETAYDHFRGLTCQQITEHYAFSTIEAVEEMIRTHAPDLKIIAQASVDEFFWQVYVQNAFKDRAHGRGEGKKYRGLARDLTLNKRGQKDTKTRRQLRELTKALDAWHERAWNNFDDAQWYGVELELLQLMLSIDDEGELKDLVRLPLAILRPNPVDKSGRRIVEDLMPVLDRLAASPFLHDVWASGDNRFGYEPPVAVWEEWAQRTGANFVVRHALTMSEVENVPLETLHERATARKNGFDGKPSYRLEELVRIHAAKARPMADRPNAYAYTLDTLLVEGGPAHRRVTFIYDLSRGGSLDELEAGRVGKARVYALVTSRQGKIRQGYASSFWQRYLARWDVEEAIPAAKNYNHGRSEEWEWRLLMVGAKLYGDALARLHLACRQLKGEMTTHSLWSARLLGQVLFDHWLVDQALRLQAHLVRVGAIPPPDPGG